MSIEEYPKTCGACFERIQKGDEISFRRDGSNLFHKTCIENKINNKNIALERIRSEFMNGSRLASKLMDEMERLFSIPALNDPEFNEHNPKVISLYRRISNSRQL